MAVTFKLNRKVNFGQELVLVGSTDALGGWELARAPHMTWNDGDVWTATIELPAGTHVEYKFALWDPHNPPVWENCPNRAFSVPAATVVTCAWDEPESTTCEPALEDGSSDAINDSPAPAFRPATVVASYEANGELKVEGRATTALKNGKASAADGAYSPEQLEFLKRKLETTHAGPSAVRQPAAYPNGHANGHANGATQYTPEQLEFMRRSGKLGGSSSPAPSQPTRGASPAASASASGAQYNPEQLAFLQRSGKSPSPAPAVRRSASPPPHARRSSSPPPHAARRSASPPPPAARVNGSAAASSAQYSPEQLAFLQRSGKTPSPPPTAARQQSAQPARGSASPAPSAAGTQYTPEQLEFLRRSGKLGNSASPSPRPAAQRSASPAAGQYTPEQLEFLRRSGKL
jgi:hypothetical protein